MWPSRSLCFLRLFVAISIGPCNDIHGSDSITVHMKAMHIAGARPNFMKVAPIMRAMAEDGSFEQILVHTGQHYDNDMSKVFFDDLGLPKPDINLEVGSGTHAQQTAEIMKRFEPVVLEHRPDWVVVVGDVNSTVACALVCSKLGIRVAHVEAGLRSFDRKMPEEINRLLTDQLADLLFTTCDEADENLAREGVAPEKIHMVGNVMIDTLVRLLPEAKALWPGLRREFHLDRFVLVTLHRPSNVDDPLVLAEVLEALERLSHDVQVLVPLHPRTRKRMEDAGLTPGSDGLVLTAPLRYKQFLALQSHAALVLTDSGGVQEETTYLQVPCLTARPNTERPITISEGTNQLVGSTAAELYTAAKARLDGGQDGSPRNPPKLWDGAAAPRIVRVFHAASGC